MIDRNRDMDEAQYAFRTQHLPGPPPLQSQPVVADIKVLILSALRRRWLLASSLGTVLGIAAAYLAYHIIPAPYTATSEIRILSEDPRLFFKIDDGTPVFGTYKQTQMRLVGSDFVLSRALSDPAVAQSQTLQGQPYPVLWLKQNVRVGSPATEFISISLSGDHPADLKNIVNAVTDAYLNEIVEKDAEETRRDLDTLEQVYAKEKASLDSMKARYRQLSKETQTANSTQRDQQQEHTLALYRQLQGQLDRTTFERLNLEIELKLMKEMRGPAPEAVEIPEEAVSQGIELIPEYQMAVRRANGLKRQVSRNEILMATHPDRIAAERQFQEAQDEVDSLRESLRGQVVNDIETRLEASQNGTESHLEDKLQLLKLREREYFDQLEDLKIAAKETGAYNIELEDLEKDMARKERTSQAMLDKIEMIKIEFDAKPRIERFLEAPEPVTPNTKKKFTGTAAAGLGMFGLIVAGIVWLEYRTTRISSLEEVGELNMRVMGHIPNMPRYASQGSNGWYRRKSRFWHSVLTESIDSTRTVLLNEARIDSLKSIMITSAMQGEGKSTLSCHLATSIARSGRRVLLIDCDMRRPTIHRVFDLPIEPGICEVLRGEVDAEDCLQVLPSSGLTVLPAGHVNQETLRYLANGRLGRVMETLKEQFDVIIVDSSPLMVNDALVLAQHVDGVLFAIRKDVSRGSKVAAAHQRLSMVGATLLGAVVIGLDSDNDYKKYNYYSRYHSIEVQPTA